MDDDDKKSEDEAAEPAGAGQEEGAELRKVSVEDLKQILAAHETWLGTHGKEGEPAILYSANLQEADLGDANLQGADLAFADLTEANNLTREQLDEACGDDLTQLPKYLADYQMKPCPTPEQPPAN